MALFLMVYHSFFHFQTIASNLVRRGILLFSAIDVPVVSVSPFRLSLWKKDVHLFPVVTSLLFLCYFAVVTSNPSETFWHHFYNPYARNFSHFIPFS